MTVTPILNTDAYELVYHVENKIVQHTLKAGINDPDISDVHNGETITKWQRLLTVGTDVLVEHGATKWISDNRVQQVELQDVDQQWIMNTWSKRVMSVGWKYWALVVPESVVSARNTAQFIELFHGYGVWVTVYSDMDKAMTWLVNVDK